MKRFRYLFRAKENCLIDISSENIFHQKLKIERSRTHRNGHVFSLVVFDLGEMQLSKKNVGTMIKTIKSRIRDIDYIGWYSQKKVGVILPYTSAKGAKEFLKNIIQSIDDAQKESKYNLITYPPENQSTEQNTTEPILMNM